MNQSAQNHAIYCIPHSISRHTHTHFIVCGQDVALQGLIMHTTFGLHNVPLTHRVETRNRVYFYLCLKALIQ